VTILAADEVMLREPRLLVPGMHPLGPVKVNLAHPLADGLVFCYVPHGHLSIDVPSCITKGSADGRNTPPTARVIDSRCGALGLWSSNSLSWCQAPGNSITDSGLVTNRTITFLAIARPSQTASEARVLGFRPSSTDNQVLINVEHTTAWRLQLRNTAGSFTNLTGPSVVVNKAAVVVASMDGTGGQITIAVDGGEEITGTGPGGTITTNAVTIGYLDRGSIEQPFAGGIGLCAIWNRVLPAGWRYSLGIDPMQFLIPA
jgi:hypothetical protein